MFYKQFTEIFQPNYYFFITCPYLISLQSIHADCLLELCFSMSTSTVCTYLTELKWVSMLLKF